IQRKARIEQAPIGKTLRKRLDGQNPRGFEPELVEIDIDSLGAVEVLSVDNVVVTRILGLDPVVKVQNRLGALDRQVRQVVAVAEPQKVADCVHGHFEPALHPRRATRWNLAETVIPQLGIVHDGYASTRQSYRAERLSQST